MLSMCSLETPTQTGVTFPTSLPVPSPTRTFPCRWLIFLAINPINVKFGSARAVLLLFVPFACPVGAVGEAELGWGTGRCWAGRGRGAGHVPAPLACKDTAGSPPCRDSLRKCFFIFLVTLVDGTGWRWELSSAPGSPGWEGLG